MYLLDTTHCLRLFWGVLEEKLSSLGRIIVSTSVISRGELIYGVYKSERIDENLDEIESFLGILDVYLLRSIDVSDAHFCRLQRVHLGSL